MLSDLLTSEIIIHHELVMLVTGLKITLKQGPSDRYSYDLIHFNFY